MISCIDDEAVYVSFESSHYHVDESDGSLEIGLVASPKPSFTFTVTLEIILNPHNSNGLLGKTIHIGLYTLCLILSSNH